MNELTDLVVGQSTRVSVAADRSHEIKHSIPQKFLTIPVIAELVQGKKPALDPAGESMGVEKSDEIVISQVWGRAKQERLHSKKRGGITVADHTLIVADRMDKLAEMPGITGEKLTMYQTLAFFHDLGKPYVKRDPETKGVTDGKMHRHYSREIAKQYGIDDPHLLALIYDHDYPHELAGDAKRVAVNFEKALRKKARNATGVQQPNIESKPKPGHKPEPKPHEHMEYFRDMLIFAYVDRLGDLSEDHVDAINEPRWFGDRLVEQGYLTPEDAKNIYDQTFILAQMPYEKPLLYAQDRMTPQQPQVESITLASVVE